jgi:flagellar biosynthesis protein FliR
LTTKPHKPATGIAALFHLERRGEPVISRPRFAARMALAIGLWAALTLFGLAVGMCGYAYFEGMNATDAFVNAAMILSGMGVFDTLKNPNAKIFAGFYAIMCGLVILIATSFVLGPVFHRILHRFHVEGRRDEN